MAEYIDKGELYDTILNDPDYDNDTVNHFLDVVGFFPAADVEPVVHAIAVQEWI